MIDLIVFSVGENKYAMNIANVQRIIQSTSLTDIPNAHEYIDGMMSYEERVIKVMNFRKLIGMQTYESELGTLFRSLKEDHIEWFDALKNSLESGRKFTKTFDPHICGLGKWIDSFTAYDDHVTEILNELTQQHKLLHLTGETLLEIQKSDKEREKEMLYIDVQNIYEHTMSALDSFVKEFETVGNSLQKLIIYDNEKSIFAIKVDDIEDIAHIEEGDIADAGAEHDVNDFLELEGVLDMDGVLINVIKTVTLAK